MHRKSMAAAFCILFFLSSCSFKQQRMKIDYYTLEYAPLKIEVHEPLPVIMKVDPFQVAPLYDSSHMIYREGSFRRDAYVYHRWRANPADLVTYFLSRDLMETGLFKGVFSHENRYSFTHVVEGTVEDFYERDQGQDWEAVLKVTITLMKAQEPDISKRIIFQKVYGKEEALEERSPQALALAMSNSMAIVSKEIINDIYNSLKDGK